MAESTTDRFGFKLQSAGTDAWPGRAGFMAILQSIEDTAVQFGQGTFAQRPAASATRRGRVWVVTGDATTWRNGAVYYDTGGTWEQIAGVQLFVLTSGVQWNKPAGADTFTVRLIGGGGGGGSGSKAFPAGQSGKAGGGGGWPGEVVEMTIANADMPATLSVNLGNGGDGGAAQTVTDSVGIAGNAGSMSYLQPVGGSFDAFLIQAGGGRGGHAGGVPPFALTADNDYMFSRMSPRGGRGLTGNGELEVAMGAAGGGGGGAYHNGSTNPGAPGGNAPTAFTGGGWGAGSPAGNDSLIYHLGGGGKGGDIAGGVAQNGGNGGDFGGGGGGGAGATQNMNSGAGGNGAPGAGFIIAKY